jgi:hypothetical protein
MTLGTMFMLYPVAVSTLYVCLWPNEYPPREFAEVGLTLMILYGMANVLLTLTFITPYRKFTLALVRGQWSEVRKLWLWNEGPNVPQQQQQRTKHITIIRLGARRHKVRAQSQ